MSRSERITAALTSTRAKALYVTVVLAGLAGGGLYLSWQWNGAIATVVYLVVFVVSAAIIPTLIGIVGSGIPGNEALGKAHVVLGAFAFGQHYLVQTDDGWQWCAGDEDRYWLDGEWHQLVGGLKNKSVLGWRPFGIVRHKTEKSLRAYRAPDEAATADGGEVRKGGWKQAERPTTIDDDNWLIDLKRVYQSGVRQFADTSLVEKAEEIIERGQVGRDRFVDSPTVTFIVALLIGLVVGYGVLFI